MLYEIDFADRRQGLYTLNELPSVALPAVIRPNTMITTDPDLEFYAGLIDNKFWPNYMMITIDVVNSGHMSVEAVRAAKHLCLFQAWEIPVMIKKVHPTFFEFTFSGGRLYADTFGLGEPLD